MFDPLAEHMAAAILPRAIEVNAIEDCTVDGRTQKNNTPIHSCGGSNPGSAVDRPRPIRGKNTNVTAATDACSRQCVAPLTMAPRDSRAPQV